MGIIIIMETMATKEVTITMEIMVPTHPRIDLKELLKDIVST